MSTSTGVIFAAGGVSFLNHWIGNSQGIDLKIPLATGIAALLLTGFEHVNKPLAVGVAWIALVTTLLIGSPRSPAENALRVTGL